MSRLLPDAVKVIKKYGLRPSLRRDLSLLTESNIGYAYVRKVREVLGFGYEAIGALGDETGLYTLINEDDIREKVARYIREGLEETVDVVLRQAFSLYAGKVPRVVEIEKMMAANDARGALEEIFKIASDCYVAISVYNCFLRFLGNDWSGLPASVIERIGRERNEVATQYVLLEKLLKQSTAALSEGEQFNGCALRFLLRDELNRYLSGELDNQGVMSLFKQRRRHFVFVYDGKNEYVWHRAQAVEAVNEFFWPKLDKDAKIKGFSAYKGIVKGKVCSVDDSGKYEQPPGNFIIVASMTHPELVSLVKDSVGIITDEGGILCHAAVMAREMHKPCVIGTKTATRVLKKGDLVEMDAGRGIIKKL